MLRTRRANLPAAARAGLAAHQAVIDALPAFEDRVVQGQARYRNYNREDDPVFSVVRRVLRRMAPGPNRCVYCEDSSAHQIDHFCPQTFYPGQIFDWDNYLWSCGRCNHGKGAAFSVIRPATIIIDEVRRAPDAPRVPPPPGKPVFINPRAEDPLDLLQLDLMGTFRFRPRAADGTLEYERANRTIAALGLNSRDDLLVQRRNAAGNYEARLEAYIRQRDRGASARELARRRNGILGLDHPTVWREMCRQHPAVPRFRPLFDAAPEARNWR